LEPMKCELYAVPIRLTASSANGPPALGRSALKGLQLQVA